jgi:hypothetical protein
MKFPPGSLSPRLRLFFRVLPEATVSALASRHHFHEVLCPFNVFDPGRLTPTCHVGIHRLRRFHARDGSAPAIYASISRSIRSWGSPFEAFSSHLIPSTVVFGMRAATDNPTGPSSCGFAHLPFPIAYPDYKFAVCTIGPVSGLCSL